MLGHLGWERGVLQIAPLPVLLVLMTRHPHAQAGKKAWNAQYVGNLST